MFIISEITVDGQKESDGKSILVTDEKNPVFAWKMLSDQNNVRQKSYRIMVGSKCGGNDMWESGEVSSNVSDGIVYGGKPLLPCTEYFLKVMVKNNFGEHAECESKFETAFLCSDFAPWEGAEFIGAPEYYVCSEALGVFCLESELYIEGGGRAGMMFGADDYRLENRERNEMRVEGENYILVTLKKTGAGTFLEIFRVGYSADDKKDVPLKSFALPNEAEGSPNEVKGISNEAKGSPNASEGISYKLKLEVTGNCVNLYVNGVFVERVLLNPLGDNDVTTFPRLNNIGYYAKKQTKVHFDGIRCRYIREPSNVFWECDTESGIDIFADQDTVIKRTLDCHALPMFRRNFTAKKRVGKARLFVAARGIYECRINGRAVSDEYFAPGASQFDKHLYYQVYDVTPLVNLGENGIGFTLSSGWWNGSQTFVLGCYNLWGDKESVMAKLVITYADGTTETVVTNPTDWDYYGEGAYKFGGFFQGERLDGRQLDEYYDFSKPDFKSGNRKKPVVIVPDIIPGYDPLPGFFRKYLEMNRTVPKLTANPHCPVRAVEEIAAASVSSPANDIYIYDLGQEIAGVCNIRFDGSCGETAIIRYGEMLYPDLPEYGECKGRLLVSNLRDASSTDKYILNGKKGESYSPKFTFHGFRYIEISGVKNPPEIGDVTGIQLSSVREVTGNIKTDHALLDRFIKNVKYSQLCNFISIPTDCPQRNERMGWAGDSHVFCRTANYNADLKSFYLRYLEALQDCQEENGNLPEIAPVGGGFGGITYGCAMIFIANDLYDFYADKKVIATHYSAMKKYMAYLGNFELPGNADMGPIDDWLAPEKTDSNLVWNAFYGRLCGLMGKFAGILGYHDDAEFFLEKFRDAKDYFNRVFFCGEKGVTLHADGSVNDTMGGYAIALAYGMFAGENVLKARERLAEKVRQSGHKITTGFFGTGLVNPMLSEGGFGADAYKMITQTGFPGWLYPVTQGATTIWERWDGYTREKGFGGMNAMNSFNHYSFGSVLAWLYEYVLGIRHLDHISGWKKFMIKPDFARFSKISGGFETPFGRVESGYEMAGGKIKFFCNIPVNTEAEIILPEKTVTVGSGKYFFESGAGDACGR